MSSIKDLFGYQKIAGNKSLDKVIAETHSRYDEDELLSDDELELAAAGKGGYGKFMEIACSGCGHIFRADISKDSVKCPKCGKTVQIFG